MAIGDELNKRYENIRAVQEQIELEEKLSSILEQQSSTLKGYFSAKKELNQMIKSQKKMNEYISALSDSIEEYKANEQQLSEIEKRRLAELERHYETVQKTLRLNERSISVLQENVSLTKSIGTSLQTNLIAFAATTFAVSELWSYLNKADELTKQLILNFGDSGVSASNIKNETFNTNILIAEMGGRLEDVVKIQQNIADINGLTRNYTSDQLKNIVAIAKGTSLGVDEASKLVGEFSLMGYGVNDIKTGIENSVNEFDSLGLNSGKILKNISQNLEQYKKFRFQNGIEDFKKLAQFAEQTRISMNSTFSVIEKFRTIEGMLDASAQLMVLGGEFAKIDPFKFSFLARNNPAEFNKELGKLTSNIASFNKETNSFDKISDIDFDRLRAVAEATSIPLNELTEAAKKAAQVNFNKSQIFIGNEKQREMLANLAELSSKRNGVAVIKIDGNEVALKDLTKEQLKLFDAQQKTLEDRAVDSRSFNEALSDLVEETKSLLLPVIELLNSSLSTLRTATTSIKETFGSKGVAIAMIAGIITGAGLLKAVFAGFGGMLNIFTGKFSNLLSKILPLSKASSSIGSAGGMLGSGKDMMLGGFGSAAKLAGLGVAAIGMGYGFKLASEGVSSMAKSFKELSPEQIDLLNGTITRLGIGIIGFTGILAVAAESFGAILATGYGALGFGALLATVSLLAVEFTMMTSAVGFAAKNLSLLGNPNIPINLNNIYQSLNNISGLNLSKISDLSEAFGDLSDMSIDFKNFSSINSVFESINKLSVVSKILYDISKINFNNLNQIKVLNDFINIDTKKAAAIQSLISDIKTLESNKLDNLQKILKEPLKVQFDEKMKANFVINNTIDIGDEKIIKKITREVVVQLKKDKYGR